LRGASQPSIQWLHADLATMALDRTFDVVAMPGNVMIFCRPTDRAAIIHNAAAHIEADGLLVAGFELQAGRRRDARRIRSAVRRLWPRLVRHCSTWQGDAYRDEPYAVSVHRKALGPT
jgi:chemotaxis methyl-accepting protein methylase